MNAITAYILSELVGTGLERWPVHLPDGSSTVFRDYAYEHWLLSIASAPNASLLYALLFLALCSAILWPLYKKHIYIKI